jgi:hypothetical protein
VKVPPYKLLVSDYCPRVSGMARLRFGQLSEAWKGEASDFTPLLAEQVDALGSAIGVDLASIGQSEVPTAGGRRIDILAEGADGSEFVIENQYRSLDHDHLTRGLAYAVARHARGLIVVAEKHRDEFRALAQYLNDLAEYDSERGICVWLVEAQAVQIEGSRWAPLFTAVVEPNSFTSTIEKVKQAETARPTLDELWSLFDSDETRGAAQRVVKAWESAGYRRRLGSTHIFLEAPGPSKNGYRSVVTIYTDGRIMVPFSAYAGSNTGIPIPALTTGTFRSRADSLFGFRGSEQQARSKSGWLTLSTADHLLDFCVDVAAAYKAGLTQTVDQ